MSSSTRLEIAKSNLPLSAKFNNESTMNALCPFVQYSIRTFVSKVMVIISLSLSTGNTKRRFQPLQYRIGLV